jgi:hypothetical protein
MSAARRARRAGRNLLIALLVGALVIAAIVVAYVSGRSASTPSTGPTPAPAPAQSSAAAMSSASADAAPTGCLGGQERNVTMLLTAQRKAPHSSFGAVEVAAAFLRWAYRYPYPSTKEADEVSDRLVSSEASEGFRDVAGSYRSTDDITGGQLPEKTAFYLSTATGSWLIDAQSTNERVTVEVNAPYVIKGEVSATKSAAISATLVWGSTGWQLLSEQAPDTSALSAGGTQFTAGC